MRSRRPMTSRERLQTVLEGKEPDRVPWFMPATMHGARELGLTVRQYFSDARNVTEGQVRTQARVCFSTTDPRTWEPPS